MKKLLAIIFGDSYLGVRLGLSFGLLIAILLSVGWVGIRQLRRVDQDLAKMVDQRWQKVQLSREAQALSNINNRLTMQVFLVDESEIKDLMVERASNSEKISRLIEILRSRVESREEEELLSAIDQKRNPYIDSYKTALRLLVTDKNPDAARAVMVKQALPGLIEYHDAWNAYVDYQGHQMDLAKEGDAVTGAATRETTVFLTAFAVLFALSIAIFVTRNPTWHVNKLKRADAALRQAHDELEEKVRERTAELAKANNTLEAEISERKQAEAGLRESEERYRDLFENANDIMYAHDLQGIYTSVNKACAKITGYACDESLGMNMSQIVAPEYLEMAQQMIALKSANDAPSAYELEIIAKDGHRVTLEVNSRLTYHDGKPIGVQGIARDITGRKRAEAEIRALQEFQAAILSGVQHGIQGIDKAGRIAFANPIAAGMLAWDVNDLIGKPAHATMHHHHPDGSSYPAEDCNIYATLHDGQPRHILDEVFWREDGTSFPVEYSVAPMHSASGEVTGTVVVFDDISERKRAEAERQAITDIVQAVITASNLDELFSLAHQAIGKLLPAENCFVALYDKTSDLLHIPYCKDEFDPVAAPQKLGRGLTAFVLRSRRPMLLAPELIQELVSKGEIELVGTLPAAWLGVPLRTSTEIIGVLVVQHYEKAGAYTQRDLEFLSAVGDQVALAIERKRAEAALAKSEKRYRELIDNGLGLICTHDLDGKLLSVNPAAAGALGYTPAEMVGRNLVEYISPSAQPVFPHYLRRIATEPHLSGLMRLITRKGEEQIWKYSNSRIAEPGATAYVLGFAQDVTDSRRAEEALTQSEQRFRDLFENASDVIYTADFNGNFTSLNKSGERMTGYTREEALQLNFSQVVSPETLKLVQEMTERKFKNHDETVYEVEFFKKGGEPLLVEVSSRAIYNNGKPVGIQGIGRDITQRKQVETELKLARDAALESVRLKSEFLANMSHEIRTPMNGVIGMTGLLLDTNLDEEQRDCAETIRASGEALLTIINDILDFSKIEAGKLHFETLDFLLNNAVEDTIESLAERAHEKKIELACLVYSDVPSALRGDPGRLRQVITNLLGNAIKFTERGEVVLRAEKESETDDDVVIRFQITDTGIGISEAAQRSLFRAFTQADGSTTRKYGGTGLGLAISKQLVELMGGQIGINSTPGQGSTVWFTARFAKQPAAAVNAAQPPVSLDQLRVLIIDDNATNRKILSHQVGSWGMIHHEADSGARALELLRSAAAEGASYDLAVLDLMMPDMDGFELARKIKSDPGIAAVNLVMLTSFGERGHGAAARAAGVAAYLTKPVRQSQLFDCLANVISVANTTPARNVSPSPAKLVTRHTLKESKMVSPKLILLAEDNVVNQKVALRQLVKLGYRADAVANGRETLEALERIPYDLVLMDCQMPEMDGYEATGEIRRREGTRKHTLIVAMTANALEGDRAKCIAAGMDDYVSKPVRPEELGAVLERVFGQGHGGQQLRPIVEKTSAPVDMKQLSQAMGDEPHERADILEVYLDQMVTNLERLEAAIQLQDAETVDLIAHNCAGTSANCGMVAVIDPLREMERMGRENRLDDAAVLLADISREFARVQSFLQENLQVLVA